MLTTLPADFGQLASLVECDLSGCRLRTLPESLAYATTSARGGGTRGRRVADAGRRRARCRLCTRLQRLWLNDNELVELPTRWISLTRLTELYARNNQLRYLPYQLCRLRIANANFSLNPLALDPAAAAAVMAEMAKVRASAGVLRCTGPSRPSRPPPAAALGCA